MVPIKMDHGIRLEALAAAPLNRAGKLNSVHDRYLRAITTAPSTTNDAVPRKSNV